MERAKQEIKKRLDPSILNFLEKHATQRQAQQRSEKEGEIAAQVIIACPSLSFQ